MATPIAEFILAKLRVELFAAAQLLKGEALKEFWQLIDDVNAIRPGKPGSSKDAIHARITYPHDGPLTAFVLIARACREANKEDAPTVANALWEALDERNLLVAEADGPVINSADGDSNRG